MPGNPDHRCSKCPKRLENADVCSARCQKYDVSLDTTRHTALNQHSFIVVLKVGSCPNGDKFSSFLVMYLNNFNF